MITLRSTHILIIAQSANDGRRTSMTLPVTLNLPIGAFVWFVSISLVLFQTFDQITGPWLRLAGELYRFLFVGWADDWPWIWLAIRSLFGGAYVGT